MIKRLVFACAVLLLPVSVYAEIPVCEGFLFNGQRFDLTESADPKMQATLNQAIEKSGITEPVHLCQELPVPVLGGFAKTGRRPDGRMVMVLSSPVVGFDTPEFMGIVGHELAHILLGHLNKERPVTFEGWLAEEREADLMAIRITGKPALESVIRKTYPILVALGLETPEYTMLGIRNRRLAWVKKGP